MITKDTIASLTKQEKYVLDIVVDSSYNYPGKKTEYRFTPFATKVVWYIGCKLYEAGREMTKEMEESIMAAISSLIEKDYLMGVEEETRKHKNDTVWYKNSLLIPNITWVDYKKVR